MKKVFSWFWANFTLIIIGCFAITAIYEVIVFYDDQFSSYDLNSCLSHVDLSELSAKKDECLSKDAARWGTFGDFFGGTLNPILSFLALIVLLRTYAMQREELKKTEETQKRQRFESTFFELFKVHNQLLENFFELREFADDNGNKTDIIEKVKTGMLGLQNLKLDMAQEFFVNKGNEVWGEYFRFLYQLLKFIATQSPDSPISHEFEPDEIKNTTVGVNEKMYSNIIRALLPDDIMKFLGVNCYTKLEDKKNYHKYKALIERYAFFEHTSFNEEDEKHKIFLDYPVLLKIRDSYEPQAFGRVKPFKINN